MVAHHDFLKTLGAAGEASRVLEHGLGRFPEHGPLHARLRARVLAEQGLEALEAHYEAWLQAEDAPPNLAWFAGLASLVTAEYHRQTGQPAGARPAYQRAIDHYERSIAAHPETRDTADHYVALAHAGRARLAFEERDDELALTELLASLERRPQAADSPDGLNITAVDTARMLHARLRSSGRHDLADQLVAALQTLDPEQLRLPAYERAGPGGGGRAPSESRNSQADR